MQVLIMAVGRSTSETLRHFLSHLDFNSTLCTPFQAQNLKLDASSPNAEGRINGNVPGQASYTIHGNCILLCLAAMRW